MSNWQMIIGLALIWVACVVQVAAVLALAWFLLGPM